MALPSQSLPAPSRAAPAFVESLDAATQEVIGRFDATPIEEIQHIFETARSAQSEWQARSVRKRCESLLCLRDSMFSRRAEIAEVICRETGKPRVEALFAEIMLALDLVEFYARRAPAWLAPERVPHHNLALKAKRGFLLHEPWGVVLIISPWNYPFSIPLSGIAPALAAGNAVVLKPSELTPGCGEIIGDLLAHADIPAGLVQIAQGGGEVGAALVEHGPDKVIFTGSVATGRRIAESCASQLIPSVLELGGKDAMLILSDADLEITSSAAVWGGFTNCGQACLSVERVYVERSITERFIALVVDKTRKLRLGPSSDADAEIGPLIRPRQLEKVEQQLREAVARGATILTGGHLRRDLGPCFFEPTVVTNVNHSMALMQEETFGPVLAIQPFDSADEAVALANDSPFGLSASVWTGDTKKGVSIAARLRSGSVMVNDVASYYGICEAPHGGRRASGWGRAHSKLGLLEMAQVKYVDADRLPRLPKSWWYGYNQQLADAADRFLAFLFEPRPLRRFRSIARRRGALRTVFRGHRI
ncbi:MAG: aldehyde dehydrogenase family protein [Candidatus Acidiferrales bacterium]